MELEGISTEDLYTNTYFMPWTTKLMGLKHELTKLKMMWTHFMGRKKGGLNAIIS